LSLEQVPPYLRGAAAPVALVDNDFVGALRTLLRTALQPIASESTETVVLRGPEAPR
jgi:hypothetical protein